MPAKLDAVQGSLLHTYYELAIQDKLCIAKLISL